MATTTGFSRSAATVATNILCNKALADMDEYEARGVAKAAHGAILAFIEFGAELAALQPLTDLHSEACIHIADRLRRAA